MPAPDPQELLELLLGLTRRPRPQSERSGFPPASHADASGCDNTPAAYPQGGSYRLCPQACETARIETASFEWVTNCP